MKKGADPKHVLSSAEGAFKPVDLAIPMFGCKNHAGIDRAHGLIRTRDASAANAHDGARPPNLIGTGNTGSLGNQVQQSGIFSKPTFAENCTPTDRSANRNRGSPSPRGASRRHHAEVKRFSEVSSLIFKLGRAVD